MAEAKKTPRRRARRKGELKPGPKPRPKPKAKVRGRPQVSKEEAERMFIAYCNDQKGGYTAVARQFKRNWRTVEKVANDNGWEQRLAKMSRDVQKKTEQAIVKNTVENVSLLRSLKVAAIDQIVERDDKQNIVGLKGSVRLPDITKLIALEEELTGGADLTDQGSSIVDKQTVIDAIDMLKSLGAAALRKLGDMIAKQHPDIDFKSNEKED